MVSSLPGQAKKFRVALTDAQQVYLVGDFNHWSVPGIPMAQVEPGVWEAQVELPPGKQRVGYFAVNWKWSSERSPQGTSRRGYEIGQSRLIRHEQPVQA